MTTTPFTKGHDAALLAAALKTPNKPGIWDNLGLTGTMRLVSPRAALLAKTAPSLPPPPADDSRTTAAELFEIALAVGRADTPFHLLQDQPTLAPFAAELQGQAAFRFDASHAGPYVSQLLLRDIPINAAPVPQLYRLRTGFYGATPATNTELLAGRIPEPQTWGAPQRINTPRALASAVHQDPPYLLALHAAFILAAIAQPSGLFAPGPHEMGFVSDGGPVQLHCLLAAVVQTAMRAAWLAKFQIYRRRRPEELFADQSCLHPDWQRLALPSLQHITPRCLPRLYAEGCPLHSDYPSGHAVIGGAAATLLKAWFADGPWPNPVESRDGANLDPVAAPLTIHGEINKLAHNYGWGRNFAGIHYRSSCRGGMLLGEAIALQALRGISGRQVTFRGFSGAPVTAG
jgi:hypothetical protein